MASRVMSRAQCTSFTKEVKALGELDCFAAMVAGLETQRENPESPIRVPNSGMLIHDNSTVNIPGMSEHSSKDFKWNRFTHEVNEFRPGIVLYKTSDPDLNMCINLFCEADTSNVNVCILTPMGKLSADAIGVEVAETAGDANLACVGPSWFEGSGYTPKAFCDSNTRGFYDAAVSIGEEAYLNAMSAACVGSTGLDTDVEGGVDEVEELEVPEAGDVDAESRERGWLESLPLPGVPTGEAHHGAAWRRRLPQRRQFNHPAPI